MTELNYIVLGITIIGGLIGILFQLGGIVWFAGRVVSRINVMDSRMEGFVKAIEKGEASLATLDDRVDKLEIGQVGTKGKVLELKSNQIKLEERVEKLENKPVNRRQRRSV